MRSRCCDGRRDRGWQNSADAASDRSPHPSRRPRRQPRASPARAAAGAKVWAVVKANAYGHGIERVFDGLRGADGFALLDLAEAERVRALGWRGPILLLEGCFEPRDLELCSRLDLWHTVHCDAQIDWLAAHKTARAAPRLPQDEQRHEPARLRARAPIARAWLRLDALPQVDEITLMTHFADADAATTRRRAAQLAVFEAATRDLPGERSICQQRRHACASARALRRVRGDWVRPGHPALRQRRPTIREHDAADWQLQPAMTLRTRADRRADAAAPATPSATAASFTAERAMRIGVVACGYADGYPRHCAAPARRCWSTACARASSAACRWT